MAERDRLPLFFILLGWLVPQLIGLSLAAARIPLWARVSPPGEQFALAFVLTIQVATAAFMLPLLRNWRTAVCVIVSGWPLAVLAAGLSASESRAIVVAEIHVGLWIAAVGSWSFISRTERQRAFACATAVFWAIGGALLFYLRLEFAPDGSGLPQVLAGPLVAALRATDLNHYFISQWTMPLSLAVASLLCALLVHHRVFHLQSP